MIGFLSVLLGAWILSVAHCANAQNREASLAGWSQLPAAESRARVLDRVIPISMEN